MVVDCTWAQVRRNALIGKLRPSWYALVAPERAEREQNYFGNTKGAYSRLVRCGTDHGEQRLQSRGSGGHTTIVKPKAWPFSRMRALGALFCSSYGSIAFRPICGDEPTSAGKTIYAILAAAARISAILIGCVCANCHARHDRGTTLTPSLSPELFQALNCPADELAETVGLRLVKEKRKREIEGTFSEVLGPSSITGRRLQLPSGSHITHLTLDF